MIKTIEILPAHIREYAARHHEAVARLNQLAGQADKAWHAAGANLFERIQLSWLLLKNKAWLKEHKTDEPRAIEYLERKYFADISTIISLRKLCAIYEWKSDEAWWKERRYHIKIINKEYEIWRAGPREIVDDAPSSVPEPRFVPASKLREMEEKRQEEIKHYQAMTGNLRKNVEKQDQAVAKLSQTVQTVKEQQKAIETELEALRAENKRLKEENAQLRKQLLEMQQKG